MSKLKIYGGFTSTIKPIDIRFCVAVITTNDAQDDFQIVIADSYMEINGQVVDVQDYDVIETFDNLRDALEFIPITEIILEHCIRKRIEELRNKMNGGAE